MSKLNQGMRSGGGKKGRRAAAGLFALVFFLGTLFGGTNALRMQEGALQFFGAGEDGYLLPEEVEAAESWWPGIGNCQYLKFSEFKSGYRTYEGRGSDVTAESDWVFGTTRTDRPSFDWEYHNWTKIVDIINALPRNTGQPFLLDINDDFDCIARSQITIPSGIKLKLISTHPGGYTITRYSGLNFESFFKVEAGGELTLGEGLTFTGDMSIQWKYSNGGHWETVTIGEDEATIPASAKVGFGNIGNRIMIGGNGFYATYSNNWHLTNFDAVSGSGGTPNIGLYSSSNSYNKEISNTTVANLSKTAYYMLAFNAFPYKRPINFVNLASDLSPTTYSTITSWQSLSWEDKKPYLWTLQPYKDGSGYYFKNVANGTVLNWTGSTLRSESVVTTEDVWVEDTGYQVETWALGSKDTDIFPGGAYFVRSSGIFTIDGAVFTGVFLPAEESSSDSVKGRNSAPIIIEDGEFYMKSGAITNNEIAYLQDETNITSTNGNNDQTEARTKTREEIDARVPWGSKRNEVNTGSAGAVIMKGGTAAITGGTIGTTSSSNVDELKHFARNYAANPVSNDGNKSFIGAIWLDGTSSMTIGGNAVIAGNTSAQLGTIRIGENANLTLEGSARLIGNYNYNGGAVYADGAFTMDGGYITANDSMTLGGGIFVNSNTVELIRGDINENTSMGAGGGIYVQGHWAPWAKTLYLNHPTNVYDNYATSSGIDFGSDRSVSLNKESTAKDKETFGLTYKQNESGIRAHWTSDTLNTSCIGNIDKDKTGSGGGIWLCPAGSSYLGSSAKTILKVGNNIAEVQGDDFMKDNGADGGIVFGDASSFWGNDWRLDNAVKDGNGWQQNRTKTANERSGDTFNTADFAASSALKLHSNNTNVGHVDGELNIYGNISRRGGGIGADGTLIISSAPENIKVVQGMLTLQKTFVGTDAQDVLMQVQLYNKSTGAFMELGTYHLSDDDTTIAANNAAVNDSDVTITHFDKNYQVTFGLPQYVPGTGGLGDRLYDENGTWNNNWEIRLTETDLNGNPLNDTYRLNTGAVRFIEKKEPTHKNISDDGKVITEYITLEFGLTAENNVTQEIEKYVNKKVHEELTSADEVFTYDIMAYVPAVENMSSFKITDTLPYELEVVDQNGKTLGETGFDPDSVLFTSQNGVTTYKYFALRTSNNHKGDGSGTVAVTNSQYFGIYELKPEGRNAGSRLKIETDNSGTQERQKVTFELQEPRSGGNSSHTNSGASDKALFQNVFYKGLGNWVQLTFRVRIKEAYRAQVIEASRNTRGQTDAYTLASYDALNGSSARPAQWKLVPSDEDEPVVDIETQPHAGVWNDASLTTSINGSETTVTSNKVTVRPNVTEAEKYINKSVHASVHKAEDTFLYDIIALIPAGAQTFMLEDELPEELELVQRGGGVYVSGHGKEAIFAELDSTDVTPSRKYDVFKLRSTNNHSGNGNGTVAGTSTSSMVSGQPFWLEPRDRGSVRSSVTTTNDRTKIRFELDRTSEGGWGTGMEASDKTILEIADESTIWVQLTFEVRYKKSYYENALALAKEQLVNGYESKDKYPAVGSSAEKNAVWRKVEDDKTVLNVSDLSPHTGTMNAATVDVDFGNNVKVQTTTNEVTVRPEEPVIEKYINGLVHDEVYAQSEYFTYDLLAYIPEGTQHFLVEDVLPEELELLDKDGNVVTTGHGNDPDALFPRNRQAGTFLLLTGNNHLGDGNGTVVSNTGYYAEEYWVKPGNRSDSRVLISTENNRTKIKFELDRDNSFTPTWNGLIEYDDTSILKKADDKGRWVQLTFHVRIKEDFYDAVLAAAKKQRTPSTYDDITPKYESTDLNSAWMRITDNQTVLNGDEIHNGVSNHGRVAVNFTDGGYSTKDSNIVTVKPEEPEVEKYIENKVHADTHATNEVFTYSVMAYVPIGSTSLTVTDVLPKQLQLIGNNDEVVTGTNAFSAGAILEAILLDGENNHIGDGTNGTVVIGTGRNLTTSLDSSGNQTNQTVLNGNAFVFASDSNTLQFVFVRDSFTNANGYNTFFSDGEQGAWGKWVRIRYKARLNPEHLSDIQVTAKNQAAAGNSELSGDNARTYWRLITENGNVTDAQTPHAGVTNTVTESVVFPRNLTADVTSNTVTVTPEIPEIEKYINKRVHADTHAQSELVTYDIMAFVPKGAKYVTISDTLPAELEMVRYSGTVPDDNGDGKAVFYIGDDKEGNKGKFALLKNNNHLGDGNGTVANVNLSDSEVYLGSYELRSESGETGKNIVIRRNSDNVYSFTFKLYRSESEQDKRVLETIDNAGGAWIHLTFDARIKSSYYDKVLSVSEEQSNESRYDDKSFYADGTTAYWRKIEDNRTVLNAQTPHAGVANSSSLQIVYEDGADKTISSNVVTVKPTEPEVEKYINHRVHESLFNADDVFEYQIMAYVPEGAESFTVYDLLPQSLVLVDDGGNKVTEETIKNALVEFAVGDVATFRNANNHLALPGPYTAADGNTHYNQTVTWHAPVGDAYNLLNASQFAADSYSITRESYTGSAQNGDEGFAGTKLSVTVPDTLLRRKDNSEYTISDEWVRLTLRAKINPTYKTEVLKGSSADDSAKTAVNWKEISADAPLVNTGYEDGSHTGVVNRAGVTVNFTGGITSEKKSNDVTVSVEEPEIEKYINKNVHSDLSYFEQAFTYDILARIPAGAQTFTISDTLPKSLDVLRVSGNEVETAASSTGEAVFFSERSGSRQAGYFTLRNTNDHRVTNGTVASVDDSSYIGTQYLVNTGSGNSRVVITNTGEGTDRQTGITFTLNRANTGGSGERLSDSGILKLADEQETWVHLSFLVRLRPEYYDDVAAKLLDTSDATPEGWDSIDPDSSNTDGYHKSNLTVLDGALPHTGIANQASLRVTGVNSATAKEVKSNIVTAVPSMAELKVQKNWVDDGRGSRPTVRDFVNALTLVGSGRDGLVLSFAGAEADTSNPEDTDNNTGNGSYVFRTNLTVDAVTYPLTITVTTGGTDTSNAAIKETYQVEVKGLPQLNNVTWMLREAAFTDKGYVAPTYSGSGDGVANGGLIANLRPNTDKVYVQAQKLWRNYTPKNNDKVVLRLNAYKGSVSETNRLTLTGSTPSDPFKGDALPEGFSETLTLNNDNYWSGGWANLPKHYLSGTDDYDIKYTVTEESKTVSGAVGTIRTTITDSEVTVNDVVAGYDFQVTNAAPQIEKYVNPKRTGAAASSADNGNVHQDLNAFDEVFTFDVQAYMADADKLEITDTLVNALQFVSRASSENLSASVGLDAIYLHYAVKNPAEDGNAPALSAAANTLTDITGTPVTATISGQELKVTVDLTGQSDDVKTQFRDKWIVITFDAQIKPAYRTLDALRTAAGVWTSDAITAAQDAEDGIDDAKLNQTEGDYTSHEGVLNAASYSVYVDNVAVFNNITSNTVTVKPLEKTFTISKTWENLGLDGKPSVDDFVKRLTLHSSKEGMNDLSGTAFTAVSNQDNTYTASWTTGEAGSQNFTVTLTVAGADSNDWSLSFAGLPSLTGVEYSVTETAFTAYEVSYQNQPVEGATEEQTMARTLAAYENGIIRNTRRQTSLSINKSWIDDVTDANATRPDSITLTVEGRVNAADTDPYITKTVTMNAPMREETVEGVTTTVPDKNGVWQVTVNNLPLQDESGNTLHYTVKEAEFSVTDADGTVYRYVPVSTNVNATDAGDTTLTANLTNELRTSLHVDKTWLNDLPENRPDAITFDVIGYTDFTALESSGSEVSRTHQTMSAPTKTVETDGTEETVTDKSLAWNLDLDNLPVYYYNTTTGAYQRITYVVQETNVPEKYNAIAGTVQASGSYAYTAELRNSLREMPLRNVTITKQWAGDTAAQRPEELELQLHAYRDGSVYEGLLSDGYNYPRTVTLKNTEVTSSVDEATGITSWSYTVTGLPKYVSIDDYNDASKELTYKLTETDPDGYKASASVVETQAVSSYDEETGTTSISDTEFTAILTNTRYEPQIAKYVNVKRDTGTPANSANDDDGVHTTLLYFDDSFTYDLQAYITEDAKTVILTDTLPAELEVLPESAGTVSLGGDKHADVRVVLKNTGLDGKLPALSSISGSTDISGATGVTNITITEDVSTKRQTLTVRINLPEGATARANYLDKIVQVTFHARLREEYRSLSALQQSTSWRSVFVNKRITDPKQDIYDSLNELITQGAVVVTETGHSGIANEASYGIWTALNEYSTDTENAPTHSEDSNTVTVTPLTMTFNFQKAWRDTDGETPFAPSVTETFIRSFAENLILQRIIGERTDTILPDETFVSPVIAQDTENTALWTVTYENGIVLNINTADNTSGNWSVSYSGLPRLTGASYQAKEASWLTGYEMPVYKDASGNDAELVAAGGTIINSKEHPEISKYVNPASADMTNSMEVDGSVHTDLHHFDEVFAYSIQAYIPVDAQTLTITDDLNPAVELVTRTTGNSIIRDAADASKTYRMDVSLKETEDDGAAPALSKAGNTSFTGSFNAGGDNVQVIEATLSGQHLQVLLTVPYEITDGVTGIFDSLDEFRGRWVVLTFHARLKDSYKSLRALQSVADVWADSVSSNEPVKAPSEHLIAEGGRTRVLLADDAAHAGVKNEASYTVGINGNPDAYVSRSNMVTVKPAETSLTVYKEWNPAKPAESTESVTDFVKNLQVVSVGNRATSTAFSGSNAVFMESESDTANGTYVFGWYLNDADTGEGYESTRLTVNTNPGPSTGSGTGETGSGTGETGSGSANRYEIRVTGLRSLENTVYCVRETQLSGYAAPVYDNTANGNLYTDKAADQGVMINRALTNLTIEKTWVNDNAALRPSYVNFTVIGVTDAGTNEETQVYNKEVRMTAPAGDSVNKWSHTINELMRFTAEGKEITYRVSETPVPGYEAEVTTQSTTLQAASDNVVSFTNTLDTMEVSVEKKWEEYDNDTSSRKAVTIALKGYDSETDELLDEAVYTQHVTLPAGAGADVTAAETDWSYTFRNLPKVTKNGHAIRYEIEEDAVSGYEQMEEVQPSATNSFNGSITNSKLDVRKLNVRINKEWLDNSDAANERPASVEFRITPNPAVSLDEVSALTKEASGDGYLLRLTADYADSADTNRWSRLVTGLPRSTAQHEPVTYTVEEVLSNGNYRLISEDALTFTGDDNIETHDLTFQNRIEETFELSVTKDWQGDDGAEDGRPDSISFTLYRNDEEQISLIIRPTNSDKKEWTDATFTNLPRYDDAGALYRYRIEETMRGGSNYYEQETPVRNGDAFTVTNVYQQPDKVMIRITKVWKDGGNVLDTRGPVTVTLSADNYDLAENGIDTTYEISGDASTDTWEKVIANLPKYVDESERTELINYSIAETSLPDGYRSEETSSDFSDEERKTVTFTNTLEKTVSIAVKKVWEDTRHESERPASVTVSLLRNGSLSGESLTLTPDSWSGSFDDLPLADTNGNPYTYTVQEDTFDGDEKYQTTIRQPATDINANKEALITNTWDAEEPRNTVSIPVEKVWDDDGFNDRPASIQVALLRDNRRIEYVWLSEENDWKHTFSREDMFETDEEGNPYQYTVTELLPQSISALYDVSYAHIGEGSNPAAETIINTHKPKEEEPPAEPETVKIYVEKKWVDTGYESSRPNRIRVNLVRGEDKIASQVLTNDSGWKYTFETDDTGAKLLKYDENGELYNYTVTEDHVNGYTVQYDYNMAWYRAVITNTKEEPKQPTGASTGSASVSTTSTGASTGSASVSTTSTGASTTSSSGGTTSTGASTSAASASTSSVPIPTRTISVTGASTTIRKLPEDTGSSGTTNSSGGSGRSGSGGNEDNAVVHKLTAEEAGSVIGGFRENLRNVLTNDPTSLFYPVMLFISLMGLPLFSGITWRREGQEDEEKDKAANKVGNKKKNKKDVKTEDQDAEGLSERKKRRTDERKSAEKTERKKSKRTGECKSVERSEQKKRHTWSDSRKSAEKSGGKRRLYDSKGSLKRGKKGKKKVPPINQNVH